MRQYRKPYTEPIVIANTNSHVSAQNIERVIIEDAKRLHTGSLQFLYNERIYRHILDVGDF